ncbi:unnamed protein product [Merluccius merluccius]
MSAGALYKMGDGGGRPSDCFPVCAFFHPRGEESFRSFGLLRELDLSLNGCCDMRFNPEDFPHLEVLDLSYNNVSEADIVCLGRLAGLKVLCLTGNRLHRLPADMAGSDRRPAPPTPGDSEQPQFGALETLTLDDNRLSSDVFHSLANLTRLQHLNLQGNNISEIPSMLPHGDGEEEALLAAALFPNLSELLIHNNPLTSQRTGDPPLLTYLLSVRRGVKVKRVDKPEVEKPFVMLTESLKHKPGDPRQEELGSDAAEGAKKTGGKKCSAAVSEKFKDHSILMDANSGAADVVQQATGIQTAVRTLERTLQRLMLCRDVQQGEKEEDIKSNNNTVRKIPLSGVSTGGVSTGGVSTGGVSDGQQVNQQVYRD